MGSIDTLKPIQGATSVSDVAIPTNPNAVPIAVVGMSCRLPGGCDTPQRLWELLSNGASGWSQGAGDRFHWHAFHSPVAEHSSTFNAQGFHLLKQDLAQFDARFFNISPLEAKAIDPQQRLLLEVAYESFENAGFSLDQLSGSNTGVYIAGFNSDYERMLSRDPENAPSYRLTGTGIALMSNRVSYAFNLKGPSFTLDTGCSGSLVALHQACQSLRSGEIDQALVGGTNLILDPELTNSLSTGMLLGDAGRCFTFDNRAEGYGRGEGLGTVVLKSLSKALEDGDSIRAVIRNTAVNQDGKTQSITTPSRSSQEAMMYGVYASAGLDPKETSYVEAHGTGTDVGDVIEAAAIATVFSERDQHNPIIVGSIKTNIGHTESTAGITGIIKAVLMLENDMILPNHGFEKSSSRIPFNKWHIKVPQTLLPWPSSTLRRASVNSFGYGGTNAHAVLDGADSYIINRGWNRRREYAHTGPSRLSENSRINGIIPKQDAGSSKGRPLSKGDQRGRLFVLSSHSKVGLRANIENLLKYVKGRESSGEEFFDDLTHTLMRRTLLPFRTARSASTMMELQETFKVASEKFSEPDKVLERPSLCFVFTGQGSQWPGMGCELFGTYPVFEKSFVAAEEYFIQLGGNWSLREELFKPREESKLGIASRSLVLTMAVQIALVDLLRSWNIRSDVVVGHSSGEIAAAYSAGALSSEDAVRIAYSRGHLMDKYSRKLHGDKGAMLAVGLSADQALDHIEALASGEGKVCIACVNSPSGVTVSGDEVKIRALQDKLEGEKIFQRRLAVDAAYHSHHMEVYYTELVQMLEPLKPKKLETSTSMISTLSGEEIEGENLDGTYWARNSISPVRFCEALGSICKCHVSGDQEPQQHRLAIVEIGPHSGLAGPIKQIQRAIGCNMRYDSALIRSTDARQTVLEAAGSLIVQGIAVDVDAVNWPSNEFRPRTLTDYPPYAWDHSTHYWHESRLSTQYRERQFPRHSLLGVPSPDDNPLEPKWRNHVRIAEMPWVKGHAVQGRVVYPASSYICMALEAVRQRAHSRGETDKNVLYVLRDINITRALLVPNDTQGVETIFSLRSYPQTARSSSAIWNEFRVFSVSGNGDWGEHCRGLISVQTHVRSDEVEGNRENEAIGAEARQRFATARRCCDTDLGPSKLYDHLTSISTEYTGAFRGLTSVFTKPFEALCTFDIPDIRLTMPGGFDQPHCLHPVTLDLCFQGVMPTLFAADTLNAPRVINFIEELTVVGDIESAPGTGFATHLKTATIGASKSKTDMYVQETSEHTPPLSIIGKGIVCTSLPASSNKAGGVSDKDQKLCHRLEWLLDITLANSQDACDLCRSVLSDDSGLEDVMSLNSRARYIIRETLASLGSNDENKMLPHQRLQLEWMRKNTSKNGQVETSEPVDYLGADGEMLERVGVHLLEILKGRLDPLTIMMEGDLLNRCYSNKAIARCISQAAEFVRMLYQKHPTIKVLEIGAGTGSATVPILKAASGLLNRYIFTDISAGFFERMKGILEPWVNSIDFQKLDIERPISEQGFDEGDYDLIIACNVLHATSKISNTMANVRKLLKSGGKLCLIEVTRPSLFPGLVFGTLPGWWLGAAEDGRVDSPLLSVEQWDTTLKANGFSGADLWLPDYPADQGQQYSAIMSTAVDEDHKAQLPSLEIIYTKKDGQGTDIPGTNAQSFAHETAKYFGIIAKDFDVQEATIDDMHPKDKVCIVMLEILQPFLCSCDEVGFEQIKRLFSLAKGIVWVTSGGAVECQNPLNAIITGLARATRSENRSTRLITVDFDLTQESPHSVSSNLLKLITQVFPGPNDAPNQDFEYAVRNGKFMLPRLVEDENLNQYMNASQDNQAPRLEHFFQNGRNLALKIGTPGLLETMAWTDQPLVPGLAHDEIRIELRYGAINFRDLMVALGQLEGVPRMAGECSGIVLEAGYTARRSFRVGDRVCTAGSGAYASSSVVKMHNAYRIPDAMSLDVAASIPIAYTTAYYSLKTVANLQAGESVLIHSAAGALGQAAVMIAQHLGAVVYVTVGSSKKKSFMMSNFNIPEQHIFSSRMTEFSRGIKRLTGGKGADVILNSLAADTVRESCACTAKFGRFIEVGKQDAIMNARLSMEMFGRHVTFAAVDLALIWAEKPLLFENLLKCVAELVESGAVGHIRPIEVMSIGDIEAAFRRMQTGKHMGKVLLKADADTQVKVIPPPPAQAKLRGDGWYVVAGGTGGLGQAIIRWMAAAGARNIIAMSRSGRTNQKSIELSNHMKAAGVTLLIEAVDVTSVIQVQKIRDLTGGKPVFGIIQGAMSLNDALIDNMAFEQWRDTLGPKVDGTQILYDVLGGSLDFFIMLSSATGLIGSYGQCNYAAGNTFQDAFARHMSSQGQPVRSLDLPAIAGAGYVADHADSIPFLERQGLRILQLEKLISLLNQAVKEPFSENPSQSQTSLGLSVDESQEGNLRSDGKFSHMYARQSHRGPKTKKDTVDISKALKEAQTVKQAVQVMCEHIMGKLAELLAMSVGELSQAQSISSYGADSLVAMELRNWLAVYLETQIQTLELLGSASIRDLSAMVVSRCPLVSSNLAVDAV